MGTTKTPANDVGGQIRKRRTAMGLTQEEFATRCQLYGFDISRATVSQIEARLRAVRDRELKVLAEILGVSTDSLFLKDSKAKLKDKKASQTKR